MQRDIAEGRSLINERLTVADRCRSTARRQQAVRGSAWRTARTSHRFRRLLKKAGLPPMRFHDLCHACASLLLVQGVHPRVVMETLGHSQISLTMNTYGHVCRLCSAKPQIAWSRF